MGVGAAFQWAPTLGGECYYPNWQRVIPEDARFQWAPTLGGECYTWEFEDIVQRHGYWFQWAPTLGGECYGIVYLITPPLCQGGNALLNISKRL